MLYILQKIANKTKYHKCILIDQSLLSEQCVLLTQKWLENLGLIYLQKLDKLTPYAWFYGIDVPLAHSGTGITCHIIARYDAYHKLGRRIEKWTQREKKQNAAHLKKPCIYQRCLWLDATSVQWPVSSNTHTRVHAHSNAHTHTNAQWRRCRITRIHPFQQKYVHN